MVDTSKMPFMNPLTYTRAPQLPALLAQRILILDGAMGTMIQRFKLSEAQYRGERFKDFHKDVKGNNELLSLTRPDVIRDIHEGYLAAGADMIETNTFGATTVAQADYDMADLAFEMNYESARIARAACDKFSTPEKPRFVLGALGLSLVAMLLAVALALTVALSPIWIPVLIVLGLISLFKKSDKPTTPIAA